MAKVASTILRHAWKKIEQTLIDMKWLNFELRIFDRDYGELRNQSFDGKKYAQAKLN